MGLPPKEFDTRNFDSVQPMADGTCPAKEETVVENHCGAPNTPTTLQMPDFQKKPSSRSSLSAGTKPSKRVSERFGQEAPGWQACLAELVSTNAFQNTTLFVIVLNGCWIGIDIEWNHPNLKENGKLPLEPASIVVENFFCVYFTMEIAFRLLAYRSISYMIRDMWLVFDGVLVLFMIIETWILPIVDLIAGGGGGGILSQFSVLRLLRLTRLTRIMNSLPELLTLVKGIANATRAVTAVMCFMVLIMYVFSIVFTGQLGDSDAPELKMDPYWERGDDPTGQELFGSIGDSMMTLFTRGTLGDNLAETLTAIKDAGGDWTCEEVDGEQVCGRTGGPLWLMWVFIFYMVLSAFCILNMLVGILCEVIQSTANEEHEKAMLADLRHNIEDSFHHIDVSDDEIVTHAEWKVMRDEDTVRDCFLRLGIDRNDLDIRMDQIEECLFGVCARDRMMKKCPNPKGDALRLSRSHLNTDHAEYDGQYGIKLEEFVQKILETRPDAPASFLDVEVLRSRALVDEARFNSQLDKIESALTEVRNNLDSSGAILDAPPKECSANEGTDGIPKQRDQVSDEWLQSLSIDVLFEELRERRLAKASGKAVEID